MRRKLINKKRKKKKQKRRDYGGKRAIDRAMAF